MSNGLKLMLLSVGTLITCMVVTIGIQMAKTSKKTGVSYTRQMNEFAKELDQSDIRMYDGVEVYGSDVVNFMKRQLGDYAESETAPLKVTVITALSPQTSYSYINCTDLKAIQNFTSPKYIKPLNKFSGMVISNENEVITEIIFKIV